jgi:hypothetical protein
LNARSLVIAPRKLIAVNGKYDDIFFDEGVREVFEEMKHLYAVSGASESCALVVGNCGHRFYVDDA